MSSFIQLLNVNKSFEKLTKYSSQEVYGLNPGQLLQGPNTNPKDREDFRVV